jgi:fluoride exporter
MPPASKMILQFLAIGLASSLGGMLRYAVTLLLPNSAFPFATLLINVSGSLFLGWFATVFKDRMPPISDATYLAIATGFVGAYTTFSTYMLETDKMVRDDEWVRSAAYLVGSLILGLIAVRAGFVLGMLQRRA